VAIEDLHWADAASVELLSVLAELTDFHPVMLLVTSRPETEANAWTFRQHVERNYGHRLTELRLAPLGEADSRRLADNLLRVSELPESMREAILARVEGNPFFLEEIPGGPSSSTVQRGPASTRRSPSTRAAAAGPPGPDA
jgi:predicted ATPase